MTRVTKSSIAAAAIVASVAAALSAQPVRTASPVQFALTGITPEETARLTVTAVTDRGFPPGPCRATLAFVDAEGQPVLDSDGQRVERQVTVRPGDSAFLDLRNARLTGGESAEVSRRLNFRPVVLERGGSNGVPPGPCLPQLEIIDTATEQTKVINPGIAVGGWTSNHNETLVRDTGR